MAGVTGFPFLCLVLTINRLGKDPRTGSLAHTPRTAKQEGMRQLVIANRIFQRSGNMRLTHDCIKSLWPVLSGGNNKLIHSECG